MIITGRLASSFNHSFILGFLSQYLYKFMKQIMVFIFHLLFCDARLGKHIQLFEFNNLFCIKLLNVNRNSAIHLHPGNSPCISIYMLNMKNILCLEVHTLSIS